MTTSTTSAGYLLGHSDAELRRLEEQARIIAPATSALLTLAGIESGMRVLDLGTGAGDVAFLAAERVGPSGSVVGIDQAPDALALARHRADVAKIGNVSFAAADVSTVEPRAELGGTFDAIVGRLVLLYLDDPVAVVRRCAAALRPGGVYLAMEYDIPAAGTIPPTPLGVEAMDWLVEALRRTGHDPSLGPRLAGLLSAAGFTDTVAVGLQAYLAPDDPAGPGLLASTVRTLVPAIEANGIATAEQIRIDTLEGRLLAEQVSAGAVMKPPTLVGAWGHAARW